MDDLSREQFLKLAHAVQQEEPYLPWFLVVRRVVAIMQIPAMIAAVSR